MKIKNLRWWLMGLIGIATAINYLDRQTLPIAIGEIKKSFAITDVQFGLINSVFLFSYGTMYAVGGRLLDLLGSKKGYALMIAWWSVANALHGLVSGVMGLGVVRFLLGIGEGGGFPGSAKVVSEWFPTSERSTAFGIFNTGSSVGAVIASPLIALIIGAYSWRWAFVFTGLAGLVWVVLWLYFYNTPKKSRFITNGEKEYLNKNLQVAPVIKEKIKLKLSFVNLLKIRNVQGLLIAKFLTDAGWFFFIFWLPKYLNDTRGLNLKDMGAYAWIPYAFAGCGSLIGGWLSSYLLSRKVSLDMARKIPLIASAVLLPMSLFITGASLHMAIFFFSVAMLGHQCWSTIIQTLAADLFPSTVVGSVSGLMGCVGTYGAMLFSAVVGLIISKFGYTTAFIIAGSLHPISLCLLFVFIKKIDTNKINIITA